MTDWNIQFKNIQGIDNRISKLIRHINTTIHTNSIVRATSVAMERRVTLLFFDRMTSQFTTSANILSLKAWTMRLTHCVGYGVRVYYVYLAWYCIVLYFLYWIVLYCMYGMVLYVLYINHTDLCSMGAMCVVFAHVAYMLYCHFNNIVTTRVSASYRPTNACINLS